MQKPLAFIYARISENRSPDETENTDYQEERARAFCEQEGAEVVGVYTDDNVSGSKLLQRKQWNRMWEDVAERAGQNVWVVARDTDRLTRNKREAIDVMDKVEDYGVRVRTYDRAFDTDRPEWEDDLMFRVMGGERYSRAISKNQKMKQQQLLDAGEWRGGPRPFGYYPQTGTKLRNNVSRPAYDKTALREDEAELIRRGTRMILEGVSLTKVTADWNASNVPTSMGGSWSLRTVRSVLERYRNAGLVEHNGAIYGDASWPKIVEREDVAAVREILSSATVRVPANGRGAPERVQARATGRAPRAHVLSGVLTCALCGAKMNQKTAGPAQTYTCVTPGCRKAINYEVANERVISSVVARLVARDPALVRMGGANAERLRDLAHELAALARDEEALRASGVSMKLLIAEGERIEARRSEIEAERARIRSADVLASLIEGVAFRPADFSQRGSESSEAGEVRRRFEALDLTQQVAVIRALGRYVVHPHEKGTRPTRESAWHRIEITPLDPATGEPYADEEQYV